jgi:hypothetical protein
MIGKSKYTVKVLKVIAFENVLWRQRYTADVIRERWKQNMLSELQRTNIIVLIVVDSAF